MSTLPPCGLYRTRAALGSIPAGRLVSFHNHGDPGPGVYLPDGWTLNRARFRGNGVTVTAEQAATLQPLLAEGLYRVTEPFACCEKRCRTYGEDLLVQLGYDGEANALLFVPEWTDKGLAFPTLGQKVDAVRLLKLAEVRVARGASAPPELHA